LPRAPLIPVITNTMTMAPTKIQIGPNSIGLTIHWHGEGLSDARPFNGRIPVPFTRMSVWDCDV
jgi:hypothetical protein